MSPDDLLDHLLVHPRDPVALAAVARQALSGEPALVAAVERRLPALRSVTPPRAPGRGPVWRNQSDTVVNHPRELYRPRTLEEVRRVVCHASRQPGRRLRVVATGHSYSDVTEGSDILLDTTALVGQGGTGLLPLEDETFRDPVGERPRVRAAAGARIRTLTASLASLGLGFENLGGYNGQTLVGAISTSTHGSGAALPPFPDAVDSLDLCSTDGQCYRIEPTPGITDPVRFAAARPGWRLVQDDAWFQSAVVSLGCMGVVTSMVVGVRAQYRLRQRRSLESWAWARAQLLDPRLELVRGFRHVEIWVKPYPEPDGDHLCMVTRRDLAPPDDAVRADGSRWGRPRTMNLPPLRLFNEWWVSRPWLHRTITALVNAFPDVVDTMLTSALEVTLDPPYLVQWAPDMFNIGSPNDAPTLSVELAFPIERTVEAVDALFAVARRMREAGRAYQTGPFSLRFVKESQAYLSMMHGRPLTCTVEIPVLKLTRGAAELMLEYERVAYQYDGRPHWGQSHYLTHCNDFLWRSYARARSWYDVYRRLNPRGVFDNHFTDRMGLSQGGEA